MQKSKFKHGSTKLSNLIPIITILVFNCVFMFPSCKNQIKNEEIRTVDTLIAWTNMASNVLIIDHQNIEFRIDSMETRIGFLETLDISRMNQEMKLDYVSYKALLKNYKNFIGDYESLHFDNQKFRDELSHLKEKIIDGELSKKELNSLKNAYRYSVLIHLQSSKKTVNDIISQEKMYQRINHKMIRFMEKQNIQGAIRD